MDSGGEDNFSEIKNESLVELQTDLPTQEDIIGELKADDKTIKHVRESETETGNHDVHTNIESLEKSHLFHAARKYQGHYYCLRCDTCIGESPMRSKTYPRTLKDHACYVSKWLEDEGKNFNEKYIKESYFCGPCYLEFHLKYKEKYERIFSPTSTYSENCSLGSSSTIVNSSLCNSDDQAKQTGLKQSVNIHQIGTYFTIPVLLNSNPPEDTGKTLSQS